MVTMSLFPSFTAVEFSPAVYNVIEGVDLSVPLVLVRSEDTADLQANVTITVLPGTASALFINTNYIHILLYCSCQTLAHTANVYYYKCTTHTMVY